MLDLPLVSVSSNHPDHFAVLMTSNTGIEKARNVWFDNRGISDTNRTVYTQQQTLKRKRSWYFHLWGKHSLALVSAA